MVDVEVGCVNELGYALCNTIFSFLWRALTTNYRPLAVAVVCPLGGWVNNFLLNRTTLSSAMYFSVSFGAFIVSISMNKSTHSCLNVSAFLTLKKA